MTMSSLLSLMGYLRDLRVRPEPRNSDSTESLMPGLWMRLQCHCAGVIIWLLFRWLMLLLEVYADM